MRSASRLNDVPWTSTSESPGIGTRPRWTGTARSGLRGGASSDADAAGAGAAGAGALTVASGAGASPRVATTSSGRPGWNARRCSSARWPSASVTLASNTVLPVPSMVTMYGPASRPSSMPWPPILRSSTTRLPAESRTPMRPDRSDASASVACVERTSVTTRSEVPARSNS